MTKDLKGGCMKTLVGLTLSLVSSEECSWHRTKNTFNISTFCYQAEKHLSFALFMPAAPLPEHSYIYLDDCPALCNFTIVHTLACIELSLRYLAVPRRRRRMWQEKRRILIPTCDDGCSARPPRPDWRNPPARSETEKFF